MHSGRLSIIVIILAFLAVTTLAQGNDLMSDLRQSQSDANVPDKEDFGRILNRDITKYVTDAGDKNITVKVELLREGPSQSGVALPKYYIWIEKRNDVYEKILAKLKK
jgi:hypothetical protein